MNHHNQNGFTLIETLIYIALLTLVIGSGVVAAFYVIDSSGKEKKSINAFAEAAFLMRKIDWALTGVESTSIHDPSPGPPGPMLSVDKSLPFPPASNPIVIDLLAGGARLSRGVVPPAPQVELTSEWVTIENLSFEHIDAIPPKPAAIKASFTANGKPFEMTKYLRK